MTNNHLTKLYIFMIIILIINASLLFFILITFNINSIKCLTDPIKFIQEKNPNRLCYCVQNGVYIPRYYKGINVSVP